MGVRRAQGNLAADVFVVWSCGGGPDSGAFQGYLYHQVNYVGLFGLFSQPAQAPTLGGQK